MPSREPCGRSPVGESPPCLRSFFKLLEPRGATLLLLSGYTLTVPAFPHDATRRAGFTPGGRGGATCLTSCLSFGLPCPWRGLRAGASRLSLGWGRVVGDVSGDDFGLGLCARGGRLAVGIEPAVEGVRLWLWGALLEGAPHASRGLRGVTCGVDAADEWERSE